MLPIALAPSPHSLPHRVQQALRRAWGRCFQAHWRIPASIAFLLIASALLLVALASTKERSEAREQVIMDTLLAREAIGFQLKREIEALQQIAARAGAEPAARDEVEQRLRRLLRRTREIQAVTLVDANLHPLQRVLRDFEPDELVALPREIGQAALDKVRELGRPAFSRAFQSPRGPSLVLMVPVPSSAAATPTYLCVNYLLNDLLQELIPWTLAQDYAFTLADVADTVLARRASVGPGLEAYTHQLPLELPGTTLRLGLNSVKGAPHWIASVLRGGIAMLATLLLWSLWALWRDHS